MPPAETRQPLTIRTIREQRGLSLRKLATEAGLSVGLVSQVERGVSEPSLETMRKISRVLEVPLFSLFATEYQAVEVIRPADRMQVESQSGDVVYSRLSSSTGSLELLEGVLAPHSSSAPEAISHPSQECVYLLSGAITLVIDGEEYPLVPGDSCYFDSQSPHVYHNRGDEPARYVLAATPPSF